jgi:hypothetical protein
VSPELQSPAPRIASRRFAWLTAALAAALAAAPAALCAPSLGVSSQAEGSAPAPTGKTLGYVMTSLYWALYQTPNGKAECPKGFNDGPREQFAVLFPNKVKSRSVVDTQLKVEAETWFPTSSPDPTPFHEAVGPIAYGLNLDGKIGPHDFTSPSGERGIDNQMYRALGCIVGFRGPDGIEFIFEPKEIRDSRFNRILIELTGVDDLTNDADVQVTLYRGLDRLLTDATGNKIIPLGSQTVDTRFGKPFIQHLHGKIEDGVLSTEPVDRIVLPWTTMDAPAIQIIRDGRFRLKLTPTAAEGLLGGYTDVDTWYRWLLRNDSTHHLSNGQISGISLHKALMRLADAHPDPQSGANTAISSALDVKFVQVFIHHPPTAP